MKPPKCGKCSLAFPAPVLNRRRSFTRPTSLTSQLLFRHRSTENPEADASTACTSPLTQHQRHDPTETPELVSTGLPQPFGFEIVPVARLQVWNAAQALTRHESVKAAMAQKDFQEPPTHPPGVHAFSQIVMSAKLLCREPFRKWCLLPDLTCLLLHATQWSLLLKRARRTSC